MTDIVERLRNFDTRKMDAWGICDEAADEIERLRANFTAAAQEAWRHAAEKNRLREALRHYACTCAEGGCNAEEKTHPDCGWTARAALEEKE